MADLNPYYHAWVQAILGGGSPVVGQYTGQYAGPTGLIFGTPQGAPSSIKNITVGAGDQFYNIPSLVPANAIGPSFDRNALMALLSGSKPSRGQVQNAVQYARANGLLNAGQGFGTEQEALAAEAAQHAKIADVYSRLQPPATPMGVFAPAGS